jgi:hypothetical protein
MVQFSKKQSKVNNHPVGENSPNLVTLVSEGFLILSQTYLFK